MESIFKIESISMLHDMLHESPPKHPLISIIDFSKVQPETLEPYHNIKISSVFYTITVKQLEKGSLIYGRNHLDFEVSSLFFSSPNQIVEFKDIEFNVVKKNWGLIFNPELIHGSALFSKIVDYSFWKYESNEALHLSEDENNNLHQIINSIDKEINRPIDKYTNDVLISHIDLLLNHCNRYYDRQFITRKKLNKSIVDSIHQYLKEYFKSNNLKEKGLPTVIECADYVNLSPNYLSDLLRKETGLTTQDHIHYQLLEVAKNRLLSTQSSIKEIAHSLGFEYPHYFANLFKKKTGMSPSDFRNGINLINRN